MKRMISLMLVTVLLLTSCAAYAQGVGGALDGLISGGMQELLNNAEEEASDVHLMRYELSEAGITIALPETWLPMTNDLGGQSPFAYVMGMSDEQVRMSLESMSAQLYAVDGMIGMNQLYLFVTEGDDVDMRQGADGLDMKRFEEEFTLTVPGIEVLECGLHRLGDSYYTRIYFMVDGTVNTASIQYSTVINKVQYIIQYVAPYSKGIEEETIELLDVVVASICFSAE